MIHKRLYPTDGGTFQYHAGIEENPLSYYSMVEYLADPEPTI
jgi:hypothetical protein